jgi:cytochrome oxidase assembly protein ShyY1
VYPTQTRGRFGSVDPDEGRLETLARADIGRIQDQVDQDLAPAYVQLTAQQPGQAGDFPAPIEEVELDEGPHLDYAGQWFLFSAVAVVGYVVVVRRAARTRA